MATLKLRAIGNSVGVVLPSFWAISRKLRRASSCSSPTMPASNASMRMTSGKPNTYFAFGSRGRLKRSALKWPCLGLTAFT